VSSSGSGYAGWLSAPAKVRASAQMAKVVLCLDGLTTLDIASPVTYTLPIPIGRAAVREQPLGAKEQKKYGKRIQEKGTHFIRPE
jgi:hypothetical protein